MKAADTGSTAWSVWAMSCTTTRCIQQAKRRLDVVVTHMNPNSILFLWWLNKNNPDDVKAVTCDGGWPIWACGLLGRGMAAYYAGSGDSRVLQTLEAGYSGDRNWVRLGWRHVERLAGLRNLHLDGEQGDRRGA